MMKLEEITSKACQQWRLYADMLEESEEQEYLFLEFFKLLYSNPVIQEEITPENLARELAKLIL